MPPPLTASTSKLGKGQDAKKLAAELQATNDLLTAELEATKLELETTKQKLNTVAVRLVEAADQRSISFVYDKC